MAEIKHYRLECGAKEEDTYIFSVKVPPRSEIVDQLNKQCTKMAGQDITFSTGILFNVQHSVKLCFAKPNVLSKAESPKPINPYEYTPMASSSSDPQMLDIFIFVCLSPQANEEVNVTNFRVRFISASDGLDYSPSEREVKPMGPATKECDYEFGIRKYQNYKYWSWSGDTYENSSIWTDKVTELRFTMNIIRREYKPVRFLIESSDNDFLMPFHSHQGLMDTKSMFLSPTLSDVRIRCGDQEFPVHRLIIAARSSYFSNLFLSSLEEITDNHGAINILDCDPYLLKEVLRFIYTGEVEDFEESVKLLFWAADKYLVTDLHLKCERHLATKINVDNATEMYTVGTKCNGKVLVHMAKQLILSNRDSLLADSQRFKAFTQQHPELMFELFHTKDVNLNLSKNKN